MNRLFRNCILILLLLSAVAAGVKTGFFRGKTSYGIRRETYTYLSEDRKDSVLSYVKEQTDSLRIQGAVKYALSRIGDRYSQEKRFSEGYADCSSLVYSAYMAGGIDIANGDMTYAAAIYQGLERYTVQIKNSKELKAGDIIFYGGEDNGRYLGIYHVALYTGDGMMIDATTQVGYVALRPVKLKKNCYVCRIVQ